MTEPRKNHLSIDGGQVKEDEHVASYKPIPDSDAALRSSRASLHKSKERIDEAEEKLLDKEEEAKIVTRVDMADAKYVVGDHRNGDAKIELDANKRQFSGLTKEELMRYADDPFWVRLRWALFALFWLLWLCMLAGAIAIIVQAPKCAPPTPRTWYERDPLVDPGLTVDALQPKLELLRSGGVAGVFASVACGEDAYHVLQAPECVQRFRAAVTQAKEYGVRIIVDLFGNMVSVSHPWFKQSENRSGGFDDYFIWAKESGFDPETHERLPPNNWVSVNNTPAWSFSETRQQFYLHQFGAGSADLNMSHPAAAAQFENVLRAWMQAGAGGVRLLHARQLLVSPTLANEKLASADKSGLGAVQTDYAFYRHEETRDQPGLAPLLARWAALVDDSSAEPGAHETVFTLAEAGGAAELHLLARNVSALRPPSAAPLDAAAAPAALAATLADRLRAWPLLQLKSPIGGSELAAFSLLLPATPVFSIEQLEEDVNTTASEKLSHVAALRADASIQHGNWTVRAAPAHAAGDQLLAVARWKAGHTGYVAVWNPHDEPLRADLSAMPPLPAALSVHRVSASSRRSTNYTSNFAVDSSDVLVPAQSTVVLSFVPNTNAEQ